MAIQPEQFYEKFLKERVSDYNQSLMDELNNLGVKGYTDVNLKKLLGTDLYRDYKLSPDKFVKTSDERIQQRFNLLAIDDVLGYYIQHNSSSFSGETHTAIADKIRVSIDMLRDNKTRNTANVLLEVTDKLGEGMLIPSPSTKSNYANICRAIEHVFDIKFSPEVREKLGVDSSPDTPGSSTNSTPRKS